VLFILCTGSFNSSIPTFPRENSTSKVDQTNRVGEFHLLADHLCFHAILIVTGALSLWREGKSTSC
jgi:hypothetical protein